MKDILDFISEHLLMIFIFFIFFGGGITSFFNRLISQYHKRKVDEARRAHELQLVAERRKIADCTQDAIKLLITDQALAEDFETRLRIAIDASQTQAKKPINIIGSSDATSPNATEYDEVSEDAVPDALRQRRTT